jgi:hypothetical protein
MEFKRIKNEIINHDSVKEVKSLILKHKYISIISIIFLIYIINKGIWVSIDGLITIGTLGAVLINLYSSAITREKESEIIPIFFKVKETNVKYKLKLDIPRRDIKRGEIQGLLSNFLVDSTKRYNIDSMSDLDYLQNIYKIQNSESKELTILISERELNGKKEEYVSFDLTKMEIVE